MRLRISLILAMIGVLGAAELPASAGQPVTFDIHASKGGAAVGFHASGGQVGTGSSAEPAHLPRPGGPVTYPVSIPQLVVHNGSPCIGTTVVYVSTPQDQASLEAANALRLPQLTPQWPMCKGAPAPAAPAAPAVIAAQFWSSEGENALMKPAPRIRPGYAVTGKTAYLETGGSTAQVFNDPTGAGALQIQASGQFWVDWGDGSPLQGPFDSTGAPYPDGTITHVWSDTGSYSVTVYEKWTARWSLAGQTGALGGLRTVGQIPAFPVRELVSVRNR